MKNVLNIVLVLCAILAFSSCDGDDEGACSGIYSEGECIPDFVFPPIETVTEGEKFYHKTHGVIAFKNGNWTNSRAKIFTKNELLIE